MNLIEIYNKNAVLALFTIRAGSLGLFQREHEDEFVSQLKRLNIYERKAIFREVDSFERMNAFSSLVEKLTGSYSLVSNADTCTIYNWTDVVIMFRNDHIRIEFHLANDADRDIIVSLIHVSKYEGI